MKTIEYFAFGVVGGGVGAVTIAVLTTTGNIATVARDSVLLYLTAWQLILPSGLLALVIGRATQNTLVAFFAGALIPLGYGVYLLL